eukprot:CAMPEP_0184381078 /NCGR_PEP_ID=MMETSP0007-20130409/5266_1 /TAXON_ID=97485 /ORGANISM="Prymnesium parvum, Strain Texoma1" /LENGTH=102 /DNA_ID=CAMNT_0026726575 /DNA_START=336 /DNA_END=644 /DNA_ORIENTATION=-
MYSSFKENEHSLGVPLLLPPACANQWRVAVPMAVVRVEPVVQQDLRDLRPALEGCAVEGSVPILLTDGGVRTHREQILDGGGEAVEHGEHERSLPGFVVSFI